MSAAVLTPAVAVGSVCSPLEVGAGRAGEAAESLAALMAGQGCRVVRLGVLSSADAASAGGRKAAEAHVDAVALAAASWFEDYLVLDLLEECERPVLLWALPGMETGALCGVQQAECVLKQLGRASGAVFGAVDEAGWSRARAFVRAAALKARLRRCRIGSVGQRVGGMTEVAANEIAMKRAVGPRVVPLDMAALVARARGADAAAAREAWDAARGAAGQVKVPDADGLAAAGWYVAIRDTVVAEGLSALAFGCYPDYMGCACLAASVLGGQGVSVACEGDVNGAVGMLALSLLTGQPTHNTDWLDPLADGSVVFSHCGSGAFSLARDPRQIVLAPVRLANRGVCCLFPARGGPVTLVNLMPAGAGYQLAVLEGQALETEMVFPGNPLRVKFARGAEEIIEWVHREGIGHHWMAGYGHVADELRAWCDLAGGDLRLVELVVGLARDTSTKTQASK